ncbi:MAG TPA: TraB/GumN family protein, partial [Allosphingosinicella sp.]
GGKLGITGEHGPETALATAARERGMSVGELEGFEFQLRMFDALPEAQQLAQLDAAIRSFETLPAQLAPMLDAWSEGDLDRFVGIMNASYEQDPDGYRMIFSNRNRTWAEWIDERLDRPGTIFMAVGAGHLAGRDSVQQFLAERGIAAERVTQ